MNYLLLASLFTLSTSYAAVECTVAGTPAVLRVDAQGIQVGILPASPWNTESKTYRILNSENNGRFLQGIDQDSVVPTLVEINFDHNQISIGNIRYAGHHSDMEFGQYSTFSIDSCTTL